MNQKPFPRHQWFYGVELAAQVADALTRGLMLAFYHRDYCGMGIEFRNGFFRYGEVWDGRYMENPQLLFSSREDFIDWLARQSDKALRRLEEADPWYWNNQTVTRQRLIAFVMTPAQQTINEYLAQLLEAAGCWRGRLRVQLGNGESLFNLSGHRRSNNQVIPIQALEREFRGLVQNYLSAAQPNGQLFIDADLRKQTYNYFLTAAAPNA